MNTESLRKINDLFVTECICYPRSGHHALKEVLAAYFGERLNYCEMYRDPVEKRIGPDSQTNYQKNHDFELNTPVMDRKYIVQVRDPIDAIVSRWNLELRSGEAKENEWDFRNSASDWSHYYSSFCDRWLWTDHQHRLVVRYLDLVTAPFRTVAHVIQFMQGFQNFDASKLNAALALFPITPQRPNTIPYITQT